MDQQVQNSIKDTKIGLRRTQLKIMGFVSIMIGPIVALVTMLIYGLPFPLSISETGTIANQVSAILPYALGMLAIFSLSYSISFSYSKADSIATKLMFIGFTLVALQMCESPLYVTQSKVGILGLSPMISGIVHSIGAIIGFGALIYWIMFCFTKSNKVKQEQTKMKRFRNMIYYTFGFAMLLCIIAFIIFAFGGFSIYFPIVFILEIIILSFSGLACIVKSELIFKDR